MSADRPHSPPLSPPLSATPMASIHDAAPDQTVEQLGPYRFFQHKSGQRVTSDTYSLVDFIGPLGMHDTVMDLGTGTGVIPLLLCYKSEATNIVGVEVDAASFALAQKNVEANGLCARVEIVQGDFCDLTAQYPEGSFSVVVSNPPYVKQGHGRVSPHAQRAGARYELRGTLAELVRVSAHLASYDGRVVFIYPVKRLDELTRALAQEGLRQSRLEYVRIVDDDRPPVLFMLEATRARS